MSKKQDATGSDLDGWPLPPLDVVRELDPPAVVWSEAELAATPQTRRSARG